MLRPRLVLTTRMRRSRTLRRLKSPKRSRLRSPLLLEISIHTTLDSLKTQTPNFLVSKVEVTMTAKAEEKDVNSVTESSTLAKTEAKKADSEEEEAASADVKGSIAVLDLAAEAGMKGPVEEEETMLPSQTTCFLTRISQLCEKEV